MPFGNQGRITPDRDIVKVIVFASIIIVLSIVLVGSIVYIIAKNEVVHKLKNHDLVNIAESIAYRVDSRLERAKEVSLVLSTDPQILAWVAGGDGDGMQKEMALKKINNMVSRTADFDYANSFIVSAVTNHYWDEKGRLIDTMSEKDPDDDWFFSTISSGERVSISIDYNQEKKDTFVFVNALMGDMESPLGVTGVGLGLQSLSREFQDFKYGRASSLWLIDKKGEIYLSADVENNGRNIEQFLPEEVKQEIIDYMEGNIKRLHTFEYQNSEQELLDLIVYRLNSTPHFLLFQIPRSESISFLNTIKLNTLLASIIVLISTTFFFYFVSNKLVNPYKRAMELNRELEAKVLERTQELQDKNTKLTDSIEYAERIQKSMLPPEEALREVFNDYFLIWQPRDTVGGDFYWVKRFDAGCFIAVGDCTGHGVPGALMSVLSISILNQIVDCGEKRPAEILRELNFLIKQTLQQEDRCSLTDDGLDIALCFFDREHTLTFAGGKASLYIRDGEGIRVVRGNKKSVGYTRTGTDYSFSDVIIDVKDDDLFYMTTDGFIDQNGGQKNHCFGTRRFVKLIEKYHAESLSRQRELFLQELRNHMGDEPQRDDITLLGFTLNKE